VTIDGVSVALMVLIACMLFFIPWKRRTELIVRSAIALVLYVLFDAAIKVLGGGGQK